MALITPLKKRKRDGTLYARVSEVQAKLVELESLPRDQVAKRCAVGLRTHPDYVPTECLLHLVRACRHDNRTDYFDRLYGLLIERVLRALPRAVSGDGRSESAVGMDMREYVMDRFVGRVIADRSAYDEGLDFFEVRFDGALHKLKLSARRKAWRKANRAQAIEIDEETGDLPIEIERAAGSLDPFNPEKLDDAYRLRLQAAINTLPEEQIRIVNMLRLDIAIEAQDPSTVTISKALNKTPKTIRKYRDRAFATLRQIMQSEDEE